MAGWPRAEGVSGSLFEGGLSGLLPLERRQLVDFLISGVRQPLQHVLEISVRLDTVQPAVLDQRVDHGAALPSFLRTEEQPVLFAQSRGPNGILDEVMPPPDLCRVAA
jgi:hypothetical protein